MKRKKDKAVQVRRTLRIELRRLASLYNIFLTFSPNRIHQNSSDMFRRENFNCLKKAIDIYSTDGEDNLKAGAKQNLLFLLKRYVPTYYIL